MEKELDKRINRAEFVRLLIQALGELGFQKTAESLETESGILLHSISVSKFQQGVEGGKWKEVEKLLPDLEEHCSDLESVKYQIYKQKYLELLAEGQTQLALDCLRNELAPLKQDTAKLHELSSYILCKDSAELMKKAKWDGKEKTRHQLLEELRKYISPSQLIPEKRLQELILQAFQYQKNNCLYHNSFHDNFSLFENHICDRDQIPTESKNVLEKHTDEVWHIQFSHNGKYLASGSKDCTAIIWNVQDMKPVHVLLGHSQAISFLAWSPDDSFLLTCSNDNSLKLWDVQNGICKKTYSKHSEAVTACAWLPDGKRFISGGQDKHIHLMDLDGKKIFSWPCARVNDLAVTHDGKYLIVICQERKIRLYHLENPKEYEYDFMQESEAITSLSLSQDSKYLLVNISVLQEIHQWDLETKRLVQKYSGQKQTRFVIRSCFGGANQTFVVSGSEDSQVYIWNRSHGCLLEVLQGHSGTVNAVSWNSSFPHIFASASDDRTIRIWGLKEESVSGKEGKPSPQISNGISNGNK
eukprot:TRINITY_DN3749_c0_g1_i1.p1 TRINITY_DN3749_c0_g1~~TRINITY_DN3749_c0_g1_i1.p1  ORF type:complete len:597 (-),score=150.62 TRINITY_DN3749_c0_g1_i1:14-1597(-)